jgi:multimeric flavodoxin WrbA
LAKSKSKSRSVTILAINGSPRRKNNTSIILNEAIMGAQEVDKVKVDLFEFASKKIEGCRGDCITYCQKEGKCVVKDDLNELIEMWIPADGILFAAPVYHMGPPGQVKCAVDRLGNVQFAYLKGNLPRYNKVCGPIVQGSSRWGGQEITIQFFIEHFLLMNCIPLTGDMPKSYLGVAGYAPTWERDSILKDPIGLEAAKNLGRRVAETARIIKAGTAVLDKELPDIYSYKKIFDKRKEESSSSSLNWQEKK